MTERKVKFTKRLSVRLTALLGALTLGGSSVAGVWMMRDDAGASAAQNERGMHQTPAAPDAFEPIPRPEDEIPPVNVAMAADPYGRGLPGNDRFASGPVQQAAYEFDVPSPAETVVRGNDDSPAPVTVASPPSTLGNPTYDQGSTYLPALPDGPSPQGPSPYSISDTAPPATSAEPAESRGLSAPAELGAPIAGPAQPSAGLDNGLHAASRSAIADIDARPVGPADQLPAEASPSDNSGQMSPYSRSSAPAYQTPAEPRATFADPQYNDPQQYNRVPQYDTGPQYGAASQLPDSTRRAHDDPPSRAAVADPYGTSSAPYSAPAARFNSPENAASQQHEGDGLPGAEQLEGRQSPTISVQKAAPPEIQVGKQTIFHLKVHNDGSVAAHDVVVVDQVPKGTRLVNATPDFTQTPDGQLMWQLGSLQPGDEADIAIHLLPMAEGEIGSVARVLFQTHASAKTICTRPLLEVKHTGPQKVLIGEPVAFDITVSNPGTGAATGVVLEENLPEGLAHPAGNELEFEVGTLKPGESRTLRLTVNADKAGKVDNLLLVRGEGNLIAKDTIKLEIIAPELQVADRGPKLRYLEREATYEVAVSNPGTAPAREVELVTYLPKGMKFLSADHKGHYEAQNHAVYWSLEELPANQSGVAKLKLLPLETGEQKLSVEGRAELGLKHAQEKTVQVDSLAELEFTIDDEADPIEVGTDTSYVVTLTNTGSSSATNVRVAVVVPPQLKPIGGKGPTRVVIEGQQLMIDPLARLAPGEQAIYRIAVRGMEAGAQRIQVQLVTDETPVAVSKEEITRVYADN